MSSAKRRDIAQVQSEGPQLEPGRARAGGVWTEPRDCSLSSLCEPLGALLGSLLAQGGDSDRASSKPASASSQSHRCDDACCCLACSSLSVRISDSTQIPV